MISDADIARAIGEGPDKRPEWWCYHTFSSYVGDGKYVCKKCHATLPDRPIDQPDFIGPSFSEWGPQTQLMIDRLQAQLSTLQIVINPFEVCLSANSYLTSAATLPLALCEAVKKARDYELD